MGLTGIGYLSRRMIELLVDRSEVENFREQELQKAIAAVVLLTNSTLPRHLVETLGLSSSIIPRCTKAIPIHMSTEIHRNR